MIRIDQRDSEEPEVARANESFATLVGPMGGEQRAGGVAVSQRGGEYEAGDGEVRFRGRSCLERAVDDRSLGCPTVGRRRRD